MYIVGCVLLVYDFLLKKWYDFVIFVMLLEKCVLVVFEGLFCYGNEFFLWFNFFVCNFMIKFWQYFLFMCFIKMIYVVGMVNDRVLKLYKIFVVGLFFDEVYNGRLVIEIFCLQINVWVVGGKLWLIMVVVWKFGVGYVVWSMGLFYCIMFFLFGVIVYDIERNLWDEVYVRMFVCIVFFFLVEC